MKQMFQLVSLIESWKFARMTSLKFAVVFLHTTYPNRIQQYSIVTHENDSSTKQNY